MAPDRPSDAIPPALRPRYEAVSRLADTVCREHLNDAYAELAQEMAAELCLREPSLLKRGRPESLACGIVYALGKVNFLFDRSQTPHLSSGELCGLFGVSPATGSSKARLIVEINGVPVDARWLPLEVQEELARLGVIPYAPEPDTGEDPG